MDQLFAAIVRIAVLFNLREVAAKFGSTRVVLATSRRLFADTYERLKQPAQPFAEHHQS